MCAMWPTTSVKRLVCLKYCGHISIMAGKEEEVLSLEEIDTISDLISHLDKKYPGFKEVFMPTGGVFNSRTGVTLNRLGQPARGIIDEHFKVADGDNLFLW